MLQVQIFIKSCSCQLPAQSSLTFTQSRANKEREKKYKNICPRTFNSFLGPRPSLFFIAFRTCTFHFAGIMYSTYVLRVGGTPGNQMKRNDLIDLSKTSQGCLVQSRSSAVWRKKNVCITTVVFITHSVMQKTSQVVNLLYAFGKIET